MAEFVFDEAQLSARIVRATQVGATANATEPRAQS